MWIHNLIIFNLVLSLNLELNLNHFLCSVTFPSRFDSHEILCPTDFCLHTRVASESF